MDLSVVVGTYNRARLLRGTLEALCRQKVEGELTWEIVVVDNNSRDDTRSVAEAWARKAPVSLRYCFESRQGVSHARNAGIASARGAVIAFTDDDVIPAGDWVACVVGAMQRWDAHVVGGRILPLWEVPPPRWLTGKARLRGGLSLMEWPEPHRLEWPMGGREPQVWGANMAFRRSVFERIGTFDARWGPVGRALSRGEEVELINRSLANGLSAVYDPAITVFHRVGRDRMRRSYFRRLALESEEQVALNEEDVRGVMLFGAPRWAYRQVGRKVIRWLARSACRQPDRFERELDLLEEIGRLRGYWKRRRRSRQPVGVSATVAGAPADSSGPLTGEEP